MRRPHARPGFALKLRRGLRLGFGITAERVAVRAHTPWYLQLGLVLALLAALAIATALTLEAFFAWRNPDVGTLRVELETQRAQRLALEEENARLRAAVQSGGSAVQIERAAQDRLAKDAKTLADENARLKQEIAVFEGLSTSGTAPMEVLVNAFHVEPEGDGRYRYRFLAALRGGRSAAERTFRGHYRLVVKIMRGGQADIIAHPGARDSGKDVQALRFRQFQRVEGAFQIPPGATLVSVEVRLIADGNVRASKSLTL